MQTNVIHQSIRKSNRNMFLISVICLIGAIAVGAMTSAPYFAARFNQPTNLAESDLNALVVAEANGPLYFQHIDADIVYDIGYEEYTEYDDGRQVTDAYFALAWIGDRAVIVRSSEPINEELLGYTGTFITPTDIQLEIFEDFKQELPEFEANLMPMILDTVTDEAGWFMGAGALAVLVLGGLWGSTTAIRRSNDPSKHPIVRNLSTYGDIEQVMFTIEQELSGPVTQTNKIKITRNWVIYNKGGTFEAIPLKDLVWVYKFIQTGKYNSKMYFAYLRDKHGKTVTIQDKEKNVEAMLEAIYNAAPWILAGFTDDVNKAWNVDRQQIIAHVDKRRAEYNAQKSAYARE